MIVIAAVLYLPEHIAIMASRATFYWAGEETATSILAHATQTATSFAEKLWEDKAERRGERGKDTKRRAVYTRHGRMVSMCGLYMIYSNVLFP